MDIFRSNLSKDQINHYFDRIQLPSPKRHYDVSALGSNDALEYLGDLQFHHLTSIPFENLTIHYSTHHQVTTAPDDLYRKIVETPGRGGYCMEINALFGWLLRSIGFQCYLGGGRVFEFYRYTAWTHLVILVMIGDKKYEVDAGFGKNAPIHPLCLDHSSAISKNDGHASVRLVYGHVKGSTASDQRLWIYQYRENDSADFVDTYAFTEIEFLERDVEMMNYYTSTNPRTIFTQNVLAVKYLRSESDETRIDGIMILINRGMKWMRWGKTVHSETFECEKERTKALKVHFGINLSQSEQEGINRMITEIKAKPNSE